MCIRDRFKRAKALLREVEEELADFGIPCGKVRQGVMIETPAAAVLSDLLAAEAEFFSIGTNAVSYTHLDVYKRQFRCSTENT